MADPPATKLSAAESSSTEKADSQEHARRAVLQLREDVELSSAIIRLADVASPVGPPPEGWERAAVATVGLLPTDGRRLRVERQRLSEMLYGSRLLAERVRWSGPETVSIRYVPSPATAAEPSLTTTVASSAVVDASAVASSPAVESAAAFGVRPAVAVNPVGMHPALAPAERNRIRRMIEAAFEQTHEGLHSRFELIIEEGQGNFGALDGLRAIRTLQLSGEPGEDPLLLVVNGDTELARVTAPVRIELAELPLAVFATQALNRGDIIAESDVRLEPVARERNPDRLIHDVASVVGMEVKRPVSEGRLVEIDDITQPLVIDRGDLVELRVVGGGVTVTTGARALGSAAAGEPVSVETQSPRRKLIGRAVASGVVEIVTRPPTTSNPTQRASLR